MNGIEAPSQQSRSIRKVTALIALLIMVVLVNAVAATTPYLAGKEDWLAGLITGLFAFAVYMKVRSMAWNHGGEDRFTTLPLVLVLLFTAAYGGIAYAVMALPGEGNRLVDLLTSAVCCYFALLFMLLVRQGGKNDASDAA